MDEWFVDLTGEIERLPVATSPVHGREHWRAVAATGLWLAARTPSADLRVIACFGLFHDALRLSDGYDPEHACRAADLVDRLFPQLIGLSADQVGLLRHACAIHSTAHRVEDPTLACCLDADRLQLVRLGITVEVARLSTAAARGRTSVAEAHRLWHRPPTWREIATVFASP